MPKHDLGYLARQNRFRAIPRVSIVSHSIVRRQLLSRAVRISGKGQDDTRGDLPPGPIALRCRENRKVGTRLLFGTIFFGRYHLDLLRYRFASIATGDFFLVVVENE